jgi:hypothetical protein
VPGNYLAVTCQLRPENDFTVLTVAQGDFSTVTEGERRYREVYNNGEGWTPVLVAIRQLVE